MSNLITATTASNNKNNTFTFAGVSLHPDAKIGYDIRFANSANRFAKDLGRYGHTEVRGIALSGALTKLEAAQELLAHDEFQDEVAQLVIGRFIAKATGKVVKEVVVQKQQTVADTHGRYLNKIHKLAATV